MFILSTKGTAETHNNMDKSTHYFDQKKLHTKAKYILYSSIL